jgi:hypothetical protein
MPRASKTSSSKTLVPHKPPFVNPYSNVTPNPSNTQSSLGQIVKEGMAFGVGSSLARKAIESILPSSYPSQTKVEHPCEKELNAFNQCLSNFTSESSCAAQQASYTQCIQLVKSSNLQ